MARAPRTIGSQSSSSVTGIEAAYCRAETRFRSHHWNGVLPGPGDARLGWMRADVRRTAARTAGSGGGLPRGGRLGRGPGGARVAAAAGLPRGPHRLPDRARRARCQHARLGPDLRHGALDRPAAGDGLLRRQGLPGLRPAAGRRGRAVPRSHLRTGLGRRHRLRAALRHRPGLRLRREHGLRQPRRHRIARPRVDRDQAAVRRGAHPERDLGREARANARAQFADYLSP